jgi:3-hydroxybutyryl-CoA dehydrogenase
MNEVDAIGIVGAGFMGTGIAEAVARAGMEVHLHEPNPAPLERSRRRLVSRCPVRSNAGS